MPTTSYKLNRCYIKLSLVNILEMVFVFIKILFKMLLFKGGVLIYAEHCSWGYICFESDLFSLLDVESCSIVHGLIIYNDKSWYCRESVH